MTEQTPAETNPNLEMWGGLECSCVRVGADLRDQLSATGHAGRIEDLDRIAALGITALRYPILWEHHWPEESIDWSWADERLGRLRELGIRPIVGLVHHGSGALPEGLIDPGFADGLARFARLVAERYPWIDAYTPINEPATTARFSGLYGFWHPHGRGVATFGRCFLNECLGTRAAMKAIREVNPSAQLIQTEDVGKTHSTPRLAYQAKYENERRWLTFDVLCGRVDPQHPVYAHLLACGLSLEELASFVDDPCPPDVLGMNHYVTSERFLDERLERYPDRSHGGNHRDAYADLDAVRVRAEGLVGIGGLMRELWERYRRPIAITEVQLACSREEQVRWLVEAWREATRARADGVDVRAITPWALLGSFDWDSLLVQDAKHYENGAFDVRSPQPRLTAVGSAIASLAKTGDFAHPTLAQAGWWRRPVRLEYPPVSAPATGQGTAWLREPAPSGPPLLIVGARGTLARAFGRLCELRGLRALALNRQELDAGNAEQVRKAVDAHRPWAVINCAGYVDVDRAERMKADCRRLNAEAVGNLGAVCAHAGIPLVTFSSDLVFDGLAERPYVESDAPNPLNWYGQCKREAEQLALASAGALVIRTSAFFGPWDEHNFVTVALRALERGMRVSAPRDLIVSPTYVPDLVHTTLNLLIDGETGLWHLANQGASSWYEWACAIAEAAGYPADQVEPASAADVGWIAPRPRYSALRSERAWLMPTWTDALERYFKALPEVRAELAA